MENCMYICGMINEEIKQYWARMQEPGDLNAIAYMLGLKSKAPVIRRLSGDCNTTDAIKITQFFKRRERRLTKLINTD